MFCISKLIHQIYYIHMTITTKNVRRHHNNYIWLLRNIHIFMTMDLLRFTSIFAFVSHCEDFYRTWLYIGVTRRMSYKNQEPLILLRAPQFIPGFFGEFRVAHLFSFLCCPVMCNYVRSSKLWCPLRFPHTMMFGSSLPQ
jgi:hypothetical protein